MSIQLGEQDQTRTDVEFGVLGPFQVRVGDTWSAVNTRQVARLATMLAGWPGELIERDRLVQGIWGDDAPVTVANTLQVHVSHLRRVVGKRTVQCHGTNYMLDVAPQAVDAEQFLEAVQDATRMRRRGHHARAAELLTTATNLWRGMPFPDVRDSDLEARRARLIELRDQACEDLLESRLEICRDAFDLAEVVADAKELVSRYPLREQAHIVLVRALAAADRPGEASVAFEEAAAHLRSTMGIDPGRALVDVHTRALNHDPEILPQAMRTITLLPKSAPVSVDLSHIAQRTREAVTDIGARQITVVEPDEQRAAQLATTIGHALLLDASFAVVAIDGETASTSRIDEQLAEVTGEADFTIMDSDDIDRAVLIVNGTTGNARKFLKAVQSWALQPIVVAIGAAPLGLDTEVVLTTGNTAPAEGRATSFTQVGA